MSAELSTLEKFAVFVCQGINERPALKYTQRLFLEHFAARWVHACTRNLTQVYGLETLHKLRPKEGVLLCANHRSFFDLYAVAAIMYKAKLPWNQRHFYPVRSNFFYETWAGLGINALIGGGSMYPPIYRDPARSALTKESISKVMHLLHEPGVVVGVHPEGKRNTAPDPFALLPAQPGIGQLAHQSNAVVIPIWLRGLSNDLPQQIRGNFARGEKRGDDIVVAFGKPLDVADFRAQKGRATVYKRLSDAIVDAIRALGEKDRQGLLGEPVRP